MQIIGIGTDIIEVSRIEKALENESFKSKFLTANEIENLKNKNANIETYAGRFAAKEAIVKALGTGFGKISALDIEITNDKLGKPVSKIMLDEYKSYICHLSISHIKETAIAYALIVKEE